MRLKLVSSIITIHNRVLVLGVILLFPLMAPAEPKKQDVVPAIHAPKAAENRLLDIASNGNILIAVGQFGGIVRSADGKQWAQSDSPIDTMLTHVQFQDAQNVWVLGYDASILHSSDSGISWQIRHHDPQARALYDLVFLDDTNALAVGAYGQMLRSEDGGASWNPIDNGLTDLGVHFNALQRLGNGRLAVVGERGLVGLSDDRGQNWHLLDFPYEGSQFGALAYGENGLMTFGMRGNIYVANDIAQCPRIEADAWDPYERITIEQPEQLAAMGWRHLPALVAESLFGAAQADQDTVMLLGVNGSALNLELPGLRLRPVKSDATETLTAAVSFQGRMIAVGRRGITDLGPAP